MGVCEGVKELTELVVLDCDPAQAEKELER